ncbi:MAG: tetratricopeptide repeat protein [Planctomycetaceae bacterium]
MSPRSAVPTGTTPPLPAARIQRNDVQTEPDAVRRYPIRLWWSIAGVSIVLSVGIGLAVLLTADRNDAGFDSADVITLTADSVDRNPARPEQPDAGPPKQQPRDGDRFVQLNIFDANKLKGLAAKKPAVALKETTALKVDRAKLIDVLKQLAERHKLAILVDEKSLTDEGVPLQMPVSLEIADAPLEEALEALLSPLLLTHVVPDNNATAVVVTSLVKATGSSANTLLAGGFTDPSLPRTQPPSKPAKRPPARPKRRPKPKPKRKPNRNQTPQSFYRKGRQLLARRKIDEAIREFSKAIGKRRNYSDALYQRGYAYLLKQNNRSALTDLSRVIALNRNHIAAYSSRATIYQRMGFDQRAKADRIKALQLKKRTVRSRRKRRKRKK